MPSKRSVIDLTKPRREDMEARAERLVREIARGRVLQLNALQFVEADGPRFRNPKNPSETWCGRGEPPGWVKRELARGRTLENLIE